MKKYDSIVDIKEEFVQGRYDFGQKEFSLYDVEFKLAGDQTASILDLVENNSKSIVLYTAEKVNESSSQADSIVFLWGMDDKMRLTPYDVRTTAVSEAKEEDADRIIADKVNVKFVGLPVANDIVAKVDTGAQITSMHATDIEIKRNTEGNMVSFNAPDLSNNRFTLPLVSQQPVKTSNGETTNRPVIRLTMKIKNKLLKDIEVNLNDRSKMDDPMLVGQNALEAGNFLVDPNLLKEGELVPADFLAEVQQETVPTVQYNKETSQKLYEALQEAGDLNVSELLKILRTQIMDNIDELEY